MEKWESHHRLGFSHIQYGREEMHYKNARNPSFSSALLDAICKSTEDEGTMVYKKSREEMRMMESTTRNSSYKRVSRIERETRARQWGEERWMENRNNENNILRRRSAEIGVFEAEKYFTGYEFESLRRSAISAAATDEEEAEAYDNIKQREVYPTISSATSCSSETSESTSNWPFLSSDAESLYRSTGGCFPDHSKSARNLVARDEGAYRWASCMAAGRECSDYRAKSKSGAMQEEPFFLGKSKSIKSKSKSKSHYKDAKKPKQPISPGSKLANFLNSLFMAGGAKKAKLTAAASLSESSSYGNYSSERKPGYAASSSSCAHSRSCLSKASNTRGKDTNGVRRTVTFYPTSTIVDQDSRPCGQKYLHRIENPNPNLNPNPNATTDAYKLPLLSKKLKLRLLEKGNHAAAQEILAKYQKANSVLEAVVRNLDDEEGVEDDDASYSSSDLFELENLAATDISMYEKELPVYETTHLETNKAIAKGLLM